MRVAICLLLMLTACAPPEPEPRAARVDAIIGGTPTGQADPQVFALLSSGWPFCSATLIHPRVLITAAHCVRDGVGAVSNDPLGYPNLSPPVASTWAHPDYASTQLAEFDLGLVILSAPVTSTSPKPMQRTPLSPPRDGRAVGYGQRSVAPNAPFGERYTIDLPITAVTSGQVRYGSPGAAICFGDSGGPFFANIDGVETLIAVHSYTNDPTCSGGAGVRVDAQTALLDTVFATRVCPRDGRCDLACPVVDFDCTCAADGQCTAACTRPELDPDCPANCGADGVCAASACPLPDTDCRPAGTACDRADQCLGQRCTNDPQHPATYCSMPCSSATDCAALDPAECFQGTCRFRQVPILAEGEACLPTDRCIDGTRCHLLESTRSFCARPCAQQSDCPQGTECRLGLSSWKACEATVRSPVTIQRADQASLPAAPSGCSTSGSLLSLGMLALLARSRRFTSRRTGVSRPSRTSTAPGATA